MSYEGYTTFKVELKDGVAWVTFDFPPVNVQGKPMLDDLNRLAEVLESDREVKVVVFKSAHPEIFVCHADIDMLVEIPAAERSRSEPILYLQQVLQRISTLPQATIAKVEGMARGGGHEFMLACDMRFAARGKAVFMQMEVGMGIVPCGGGNIHAYPYIPCVISYNTLLWLFSDLHVFAPFSALKNDIDID